MELAEEESREKESRLEDKLEEMVVVDNSLGEIEVVEPWPALQVVRY